MSEREKARRLLLDFISGHFDGYMSDAEEKRLYALIDDLEAEVEADVRDQAMREQAREEAP